MSKAPAAGTDQAPPAAAPAEPPSGSDPGAAGAADAAGMLLAFVHERDVECPRCGYNLRNLTRPVCPECDEPLRLKVGVEKIRLIWLLAVLAPGFFSGIAGVILLVPITTIRGAPIEMIITCLFGLASGAAALVIGAKGRSFIRQSDLRQAIWVFMTWTIHIVAFVIFLATV